MQTFKIEKTDSQCVVTWRHFSAVFPLFSLFIGLGILCAFVIRFVCVPLELPDILFALLSCGLLLLPFLVVSINILFGKTKLVLGENGLTSTFTSPILKHEKRIDLIEIRCFEKIVCYAGGILVSCSFHAVCQSRNVRFNLPSKDCTKELDDLCNQLNVFLETLKAEAVY